MPTISKGDYILVTGASGFIAVCVALLPLSRPSAAWLFGTSLTLS
jgi:hypothetical protein